MVRQARSEATRRRIITSAVQLFSENGYGATGLGDIIEHAALTKGALYYHFDSKDALATAIIEEGIGNLLRAFNSIGQSSAPALERVIHGVFVAAGLLDTDTAARVAVHLLRGFGEFNETAARTYNAWLDNITSSMGEAIEEGDVRPDLDHQAVGETLYGAALGLELLSSATGSGTDLLQRLTRMWELLLPTIVTAESLPYFREFLARESLRHSAPE